MDKQVIVEKISALIVDRGLTEVSLESVAPGSGLREDLGFDSLKMVEFVVALEEEFAITFDDSTMSPEQFSTVEAVAELIGSMLSG